MSRVLPPAFFDRDPSHVAPALLGKFLVRVYNGEYLIGKITETEAYLPFGDEASHGFKRTKTRDSLYMRGGHAYVYALRHHFLVNVVTQNETKPGAVLIRAVEPVEGLAIMERLRNKTNARDFLNGPGKVTQALGITRLLDGIDLTKKNGELYVEDRGVVVEADAMLVTRRIGISKAVEMPLRFLIR